MVLPEVEEDAFAREQSAHEIEIGLVVLRDVRARRVAATELEDVRHLPLTQHLVDDGGNRLALEYARVHAQLEQAEARAQLQMNAHGLAIEGPADLVTSHDAVNDARHVARLHHDERARMAEQRFFQSGQRVDVLRRDQLDVDLVRLIDALFALEVHDAQVVRDLAPRNEVEHVQQRCLRRSGRDQALGLFHRIED